jgi:hypothetical protein
MDDIRMYDQALTRSELVAVYNGFDPSFALTSSNTQPVYSVPSWLLNIMTSNQSMYSHVYRPYIEQGDDKFWKVTTSTAVASSFVRGNPFNETLAEVVSMPFSPTALRQGVSPINQYFLLFDHNFSTFPAKPATLPGRQFAIGLGHNNTLINLDGLPTKAALLCRDFTLDQFGGDPSYPTFQSWAQFDSSQCRAPNASGLVRMSIKFALPNDSTLDAVVYQLLSDPFEVILPRYQTFTLPFANTEIVTLPMVGSETTTTEQTSAPTSSTSIQQQETNSTTTTTTTTTQMAMSEFPSPLASETESTNNDALIGGIVGGVVGLICIIAAIVAIVIVRNRRQKQQSSHSEPTMARGVYSSSARVSSRETTSNYDTLAPNEI